ELAPHVDERAPGVAGVDRGIRLDEVFDDIAAADGGADAGSTDCADDPGRHGVAEAEGIADSDHEITDFDGTRIPDRDFHQVVRLHLQYRNIGGGVRAHYLGIQRILVEQEYLDLVRAVDHV